MMYNKNNLLVHNMCSKSGEEELSKVLFNINSTVATNRVFLLEVKGELNESIEDYPIKRKIVILPLLVEKETVKKAYKNLKKNKNLPILENCILGETENFNEIISTNLNNESRELSIKNEFEFPKYEDVIPRDKPNHSVILNIEYLKIMAETLSKMERTNDQVEIEFRKDKPVVFKMKASKQDITGIIMPIKVK